MCNVTNTFLLNIVRVTARFVTDVSIGMSFSDIKFTKYETRLELVAFSKFYEVKLPTTFLCTIINLSMNSRVMSKVYTDLSGIK